MRMALDVTLPEDPETRDQTPVAVYLRNMLPRLRVIRQLARAHTLTKQEQNQTKYNKTARPREFALGAKVIIHSLCQTVGEKENGM